MVIETKHGNKLWIVNADLMLVDHLIEPQDWIDNHRRSQCVVCLSKFSAFRRKHHCRTCGEVVCHRCSDKRLTCLNFKPTVEAMKTLYVRICVLCCEDASVDSPLLPPTARTPTESVEDEPSDPEGIREEGVVELMSSPRTNHFSTVDDPDVEDPEEFMHTLMRHTSWKRQSYMISTHHYLPLQIFSSQMMPNLGDHDDSSSMSFLKATWTMNISPHEPQPQMMLAFVWKQLFTCSNSDMYQHVFADIAQVKMINAQTVCQEVMLLPQGSLRDEIMTHWSISPDGHVIIVIQHCKTTVDSFILGWHFYLEEVLEDETSYFKVHVECFLPRGETTGKAEDIICDLMQNLDTIVTQETARTCPVEPAHENQSKFTIVDLLHRTVETQHTIVQQQSQMLAKLDTQGDQIRHLMNGMTRIEFSLSTATINDDDAQADGHHTLVVDSVPILEEETSGKSFSTPFEKAQRKASISNHSNHESERPILSGSVYGQ